MLLLSSGVTITFAHRAILKAQTYHKHKVFAKHLMATIILGITFLVCQGIEYKYGITFSWKENVYGSIFFVTTGFHGFHVTIGTLFLLFCLVRALFTMAGLKPVKEDSYIFAGIWWIFKMLVLKNRTYDEKNQKSEYWKHMVSSQKWLMSFGFYPKQHLGFEAAAWYWHFVDVVWLFLFITVYWWGS